MLRIGKIQKILLIVLEYYEDAACSSLIEGDAFNGVVGECTLYAGQWGFVLDTVSGCDTIPTQAPFDGAAEFGTTLALVAGTATLGAM